MILRWQLVALTPALIASAILLTSCSRGTIAPSYAIAARSASDLEDIRAEVIAFSRRNGFSVDDYSQGARESAADVGAKNFGSMMHITLRRSGRPEYLIATRGAPGDPVLLAIHGDEVALRPSTDWLVQRLRRRWKVEYQGASDQLEVLCGKRNLSQAAETDTCRR